MNLEQPASQDKPCVGIVFESGANIGTGHSMRCATLAEALAQQGCEVVALSFGELAPFARTRLEKTCSKLTEDHMPPIPYVAVLAEPLEGADVLVFDGYGLGHYIDLCAKDGFAVAVIDDNLDLPIRDAKAVINPNAHADTFGYQYLTEAELYLGVRHSLVRPEVLALGQQRDLKNPETLLVAFGGTDTFGMTLQVAQRLQDSQWPKKALFALSARHPDRPALDAIITESAGRFALADADLTEAFSTSDIALIGGGTMIWEVAYLGLPTVGVITAENQRLGTGRAGKEGLLIATEATDVDAILEKVFELADSEQLRRELHEKGVNSLDALGAQRCAAAVIDIYRRAQLGR